MGAALYHTFQPVCTLQESLFVIFLIESAFNKGFPGATCWRRRELPGGPTLTQD